MNEETELKKLMNEYRELKDKKEKEEEIKILKKKIWGLKHGSLVAFSRGIGGIGKGITNAFKKVGQKLNESDKKIQEQNAKRIKYNTDDYLNIIK